jgi:predicted aspartyl protease
MPAYDASLFNPPAPLARVTLRNPESGAQLGDVPMLVDTGADLTLVPQGAVEMLNIDVDRDQPYQVMSFDGTRSTAKVVQLELILLRWIFKGRFLVVDREPGILGRDILNHLVLLFDGPRLTWSQQETREE